MEPEVVHKVMEIRDLEIHNGHYYIVVVASAISFAVTQIVKPFIKTTCDDKADAITRIFAVAAGATVGWTMSYDIVDLWLGAAAGALNAFIVKLVKKKAQSSLGVSETPVPESKPKSDD
jgi:hypothetical protein